MPYTASNGRLFLDSRTIELKNMNDNVAIHYTLDGSIPTEKSPLYTGGFTIKETAVLKAIAIKNGYEPSRLLETKFTKAIFNSGGELPSIQRNYTVRSKYDNGENGLLDGQYGSENLHDGRWAGVVRENLEAVVDLGKATTIESLELGFLINTSSWLFPPQKVTYYTSENGKDFIEVGSVVNNMPETHPKIHIERYTKKLQQATTTRYIKVIAKPFDAIPAWHMGAGNNPWIFADELVIE
ncbi:chitobiase/beta-hexosaminidase C-terminal domain-containing protein [Limibacter armeniacum]|uniref:chitobiase/beta-hexosaminidase C-terminal domain-containing protein n=1 Tax=Limibacter armeniacum TaxID=466084 RepID=UPI002FE6C121